MGIDSYQEAYYSSLGKKLKSPSNECSRQMGRVTSWKWLFLNAEDPETAVAALFPDFQMAKGKKLPK